MSKLSDVTNAAIKTMLGNRCITSAALAYATVYFTTTGTLSYIQGGQFKTFAATSVGSMVPVADSLLSYVQPAGKTVYYTVAINGAGAAKVFQGSYVGQRLALDPSVGVGVSQLGASWVGDGSIPDVPGQTFNSDGTILSQAYVPIGVIKIVTDAGYTFTPGTTALNATGVTATYANVAVLPRDPADLTFA